MSKRGDRGGLSVSQRVTQSNAACIRIAMRVKAKLCYVCGDTSVEGGRKICEGCSKRAVHHNAVSGFRKILKSHGINEPLDAKDALDALQTDDIVIQALKEALESCAYQSFKG